jgi:UDP:flavonoid glycosyltransferase YjiC (YdhE family)
VGVSLPRRLVTARGIRLSVRRVLADQEYGVRARRLHAWAQLHDGGVRAAQAVEELASR